MDSRYQLYLVSEDYAITTLWNICGVCHRVRGIVMHQQAVAFYCSTSTPAQHFWNDAELSSHATVPSPLQDCVIHWPISDRRSTPNNAKLL